MRTKDVLQFVYQVIFELDDVHVKSTYRCFTGGVVWLVGDTFSLKEKR